MKVRFDPEVNALYVRFSDSAIEETAEVSPGVMLDYDAQGRVVAMEVLDVTKVLAPTDLKDLAAISVDS